ncbi:hypothetical protein [Mesorhizobium sp.]|uniref:hypothetical protein n=1 Tax=Mesorhizobium sp. TaxID=1871066 RepID=UPI000FE7C586|nr:hypothetical protein [Mesorhizobium sp.]RWF01137.1 MAG: hypothetical protein EOS68_08405 [Mesorhizobium sp.]
MALPGCARRASSNIGIRAGPSKSKGATIRALFCFAATALSASDRQHHIADRHGGGKGMDCACAIEQVFATLGGKLFRIDLAKFHKACAVGPAGHPLDAPNSART